MGATDIPIVAIVGNAKTSDKASAAAEALGRELKEEETLSQAGIPASDRLMMTADVTAG